MFYGLCFLALYILFNAYMCFLSFFELHQLQLSCTAPRSTVCHSRVSSTSSSSCALSSLYKAPDARVAASSLVPAGDAALKKKIPVTALVSRKILYRIYIAIRVVRSINACAVVCTDTLSTLRPGSARHSGQIGCGGPGRGGTAERPAASRQGGAQLLTCEDASDADCDDGGPSPAQITRSAPTAPTAMT